jgi:NADH dehydrogenase [ubiquinone] 1 alpha subcomplex assembly factor 7
MARPPPTKLETRLAAAITQTGPIGIDAFMAQALYDPQDGYYIVQKPIGARGDFTTAPEISQIFGELIGLWLAQSWLDLDAPSPFHLIELGPGQGTLMADILRVGAKVPGFVAAAQVHLVERNVHLRAVQAQKLSAFAPNWHDDMTQIPEGPSLIIGNEFLDCMPISQFVRVPDGWREKQVGVNSSGRLTFGLGPLLPNQPDIAQADDAVGSVREVAPELPTFVTAIASRLKSHVGRALLIDYTDTSGKTGDTLQALYRHTKVHPLDHLGKADLTAHVDFIALIKLAREAHLETQGPITQRQFLLDLGIEARAQALIVANPHCANDVQQALERLIGEAHMGALFCVVSLDSRFNDGRGPPLGF